MSCGPHVRSLVSGTSVAYDSLITRGGETHTDYTERNKRLVRNGRRPADYWRVYCLRAPARYQPRALLFSRVSKTGGGETVGSNGPAGWPTEPPPQPVQVTVRRFQVRYPTPPPTPHRAA